MREIAVASGAALSDKVLFSVPMDESMARQLLLGAVTGSTQPVTGHSGATPDTQPLVAAATKAAASAAEAEASKGRGEAEEEEPKELLVVTRSRAKEEALEMEREKAEGKRVELAVPMETINPLLHSTVGTF